MTDDDRSTRPRGARHAARMLGRAALLRCPQCGSGGVLASWFRPRSRCPECRLRLDRGEADFFIGGYTINFVVAEGGLVVFLLALAIVSWPDVPWDFIYYGGIALMVLLPLLFFPFSRMLWLAVDLVFRPASREDYEEGSGPRSW